jgi:murein DD-endopeptidase MepM/ murein hydrolase activator NlpD
MRQAAYLSGYGRGAFGVMAAACLGLALAGCSSGVSRFDFPSFNLTGSDTASNAPAPDQDATASLPPVPEESVYAQGEGSARLTRANLPPPDYSPRPAAYSPAPSGRVAAAEANYPAPLPPQAEPAVLRPKVQGAHVKVEPGDTLSSLSRRYGVPVERIMAANDLPDGRLRVGQELTIPGAKQPKPVETIAASAPVAPPAPGQSTYKVAKGDTPHSIAEKLGVSERSLIARNKLNPNNLRIGQTLIVPDKSAEPAVAAKDDAPLAEPAVDAAPEVRKVKTTTIPAPGTSLAEEEANSYNADAKPGQPASKTQDAASDDIPASPETTGPGSQRLANNGQLPTPEPMSGNSFRWPVKGRIIAEFGARPDGGHNDGIDVAVPQGTSVKAAENGVVAYAGNELKGYGNLVLIRHANNWVSAYANNEEILVKRGDKVARGQTIAKAGATGSVSQPQVHFELRKGSRPVDPTKYMSDQAANAD